MTGAVVHLDQIRHPFSLFGNQIWTARVIKNIFGRNKWIKDSISVTCQACPDVEALVSGVTTDLLLAIYMFKKKGETNRALRSNYCCPCWWQCGLSGSWIRAASDVLCQAVISSELTVSCPESPQKPHKDKRAELKLLPPWGILPQWKPLRTWLFSTSKETGQPPPIIRLLLGPADFQPLENKNGGVIQPSAP